MSGTRVLHLATRAEWQSAQVTGEYRDSTRGADLTQVGYVHASTSAQLPRVVEALYAGDDLDDHVLLVVDVPACQDAGSPVRWEVPADAHQPFPHVHGPVPLAAVVAALPVVRGADGAFVLPDLTGLDVIEQPPGSSGAPSR